MAAARGSDTPEAKSPHARINPPDVQTDTDTS